MSKSLIQTSNQTSQIVAANGIISLGSVLRRFGCNLRLSGNNAIEVSGEGYYGIMATVTVTPTEAGTVTVAAFADGVQLPGAIAETNATAGTPVTLPILTTIRERCCDDTDNVTFLLITGAGTVNNISVRVVKD